MRSIVLALLLSSIVASGSSAEVLVDTGEPGGLAYTLSTRYLSSGIWQFLAQGFSITEGVAIQEIEFNSGTSYDYEAGTIRVRVLDAIGPEATAVKNLVGTWDVYAPAGDHVLVVPVDEFLPVGEYYVVFSPRDFSGVLLASGDLSQPLPYGASDPDVPDLAFPPASPFYVSHSPAISMRILGEPVPEPSATAMFACGFAGLVVLSRTRFRVIRRITPDPSHPKPPRPRADG